MNITLVLNRHAGTLRGLDAQAVADELAARFRDAGHEVRAVLGDGREAGEAIAAACADRSCEVVVVGGGDGTISAAAAEAAKTGTTLGILPLGTMNLFARSLGIPLDMHAAAEALAGGRRIAVDIGEVNGRRFIHHVALGIHAKVLRMREGIAYDSRVGKMRASFQAWWMVVREPPRLTADIDADGRVMHRRTAAILVSNNPLGDGHLPYADDPRKGMLGLYIVKSRRLPDLVDLGARILVGRISENPHLETLFAREVEIAVGGPPQDASVDGEVVRLASPIRCRIHQGGLNVLAPPPQD